MNAKGIPSKPGGARYALVFRTADYSRIANVVAGALRADAHVPVVRWGETCVCCNRPEPGTCSVECASDRYRAEPVQVPCCYACRGHAFARTGREMTAACVFVVAIAILGWGVSLGSYSIAAAGAVGGLIILGWLVLEEMRQRWGTRGGHHLGLGVYVGPAELSIKTRNRRLISDLARLNGKSLYRVR